MWRVLDVVVGDPDGDVDATRARRAPRDDRGGHRGVGRARGRAREDRRVYTQRWKFAAALSRPRFESRRADAERRRRVFATPRDGASRRVRRRQGVAAVSNAQPVGARARGYPGDVGPRGWPNGGVSRGAVREGGGEEELRAKAEAWAEALLGEDGERTNACRPDETDAEPEPSDAAGRGS